MAGHKRPRCTATASSTGEQCLRRAIPGGTVCPTHGGSTGHIAAAAEKRAAMAKAGEIAARLGVIIDPEDPYEGAAAAMRMARTLAQDYGQAVIDLGPDGTRYEHGKAGEQARTELVTYQRAISDLGTLSASFIRLGLDERMLALAEKASTLATAVILAALGALPLDDGQRRAALTAADDEFGRQLAMLGM